MYLYRAVRQELFHPDLGVYRSFGLSVLYIALGRGRRVAFLPDVSPDGAFAAALAARCTAAQLEPCHLRDAVEDALP